MDKVIKFFNTAGPVDRENHYKIDPISRINLDEIRLLIDSQKYFVLHAPRQTGKTSLLLALMKYLNNEGKYNCVYMNVEPAQAARENVSKGIMTILMILADEIKRTLKDSFPEDNWEQIFEKKKEFYSLQDALMQWCEQSSKPVVLLIDEIDSLIGDTLISVLRQLRSGYPKRPGLFPQSIILCGVRDVRDYRIHSDIEKTIITGGSAFNIKAESLKLGNLTIQEIKELYLQHTEETGQPFNEDVFPLVWELTEGQPWLVNALAYETCFKMPGGKDRSVTITREMINQAKENLIVRRETHLDQLSDKLKEERVRRVIEPIIAGSMIGTQQIPTDDVDYVIDLGLVKKDGQIRIANRIYQEVIPRELTYTTQLTLSHDATWYIKEDETLDMEGLLTAFQQFFRENFEHWVGGFDYAEAGPQLLLQAFLQRIVNGGGRVEREYGLGRQRTDLLVMWRHKGDIQKTVIELKLLHGSLDTTVEKGLEQTWQYMDKCGTKEGYLLIFNRSSGVSWEEKIFKREESFNGAKITVLGM